MVTPHAGVWIETALHMQARMIVKSLPMRECGLKLFLLGHLVGVEQVTPHAGVWIETPPLISH